MKRTANIREMDLSLVSFTPSPASENPAGVIYRECLKNHAASVGGQSFDGCGEFMNGFKDQTLKCAACGCHRNFHRRETSPNGPSPKIPSPTPVSFLPPPPRRLGALIRKRYRTKFTAEQKEEMRIFADKLGWRIQKNDREKLEKFCAQIGVKRRVLKIWMHNHKSNFSSSAGGERDPAGPPSPNPAIFCR